MNTNKVDTDWDDIRVFLAVLEHGNLVAAAEQLGISQPTAGRRLAALEAALCLPLFVRTGRRMLPTDAGLSIVESARQMQREMHAIQRLTDGQHRGLRGNVRISASEGTGSKWLVPVLAEFKRKYPEITIDLRIEARNVDLVQREADIALRMGRPTQPALIVRKLATVGFGLYASSDYLEGFGAVNGIGDLDNADWVHGHFSERVDDVLLEFLSRHQLSHRIGLSTNSPAAQIEGVRRGMGFGLLSHRWATIYPDLRQVLPDLSMQRMELWLVTHEDLRHSARIKAVADHIAESARRSSPALAGEAPEEVVW
ncbi:LysR family transcriptional regulator [Haliea sp. E17]|uniref:LysR family transcriptional regulator n=1 Tax=Haliea sp. E17 TaxID=3401576 RepID=UPI003AAE086C